jgi:hypothetical protein
MESVVKEVGKRRTSTRVRGYERGSKDEYDSDEDTCAESIDIKYQDGIGSSEQARGHMNKCARSEQSRNQARGGELVRWARAGRVREVATGENNRGGRTRAVSMKRGYTNRGKIRSREGHQRGGCVS